MNNLKIDNKDNLLNNHIVKNLKKLKLTDYLWKNIHFAIKFVLLYSLTQIATMFVFNSFIGP